LKNKTAIPCIVSVIVEPIDKGWRTVSTKQDGAGTQTVDIRAKAALFDSNFRSERGY